VIVIGHMSFRDTLHWSHQYVHRQDRTIEIPVAVHMRIYLFTRDPLSDRIGSGCMKNRGAACIIHIAENTDIQVTRSLFLAFADELRNTNGEEPARSLFI